MIIETLSAFGSICSIYSVFKTKGTIDSNYKKKFAKCIVALDYFKVAHTQSQALRECCLTTRTNGSMNQSSTTASTFSGYFDDLTDHASILDGFNQDFKKDIFDSEEISTDKYNITPFAKELRGVQNSTKQIIKYLDLLQPLIDNCCKWHDGWDIGQYNPGQDVAKLYDIMGKMEQHSRRILMFSNMAILDSITLFKSTVELLEN